VRYLNLLLVCAPIAILGELLGWSSTLVFLTAALSVIPAAGLMGRATEELAAHTGPRLGGLLNATLGNAAELIITLFAIAVMLGIYVFGIIFAFRFTSTEPTLGREVEAEAHAAWSSRTAALVLLAATALIAVLSEVLVGAVEETVITLGISEFFIGIIVVPLVGNVAEHAVAVQTAYKNKMELSMAVSLGSSLQIALFVAPILVFISLLMNRPLTLVFNQFEIVALFVGVLIASFAAQDGESNWLEGAQLLALYAILAMAFFFLPT